MIRCLMSLVKSSIAELWNLFSLEAWLLEFQKNEKARIFFGRTAGAYGQNALEIREPNTCGK